MNKHVEDYIISNNNKKGLLLFKSIYIDLYYIHIMAQKQPIQAPETEVFFRLTLDIVRQIRSAKLSKNARNILDYLFLIDPFGNRGIDTTWEFIRAEFDWDDSQKYKYLRAKAELQKANLFDFSSRVETIRNKLGSKSPERIDSNGLPQTNSGDARLNQSGDRLNQSNPELKQSDKRLNQSMEKLNQSAKDKNSLNRPLECPQGANPDSPQIIQINKSNKKYSERAEAKSEISSRVKDTTPESVFFGEENLKSSSEDAIEILSEDILENNRIDHSSKKVEIEVVKEKECSASNTIVPRSVLQVSNEEIESTVFIEPDLGSPKNIRTMNDFKKRFYFKWVAGIYFQNRPDPWCNSAPALTKNVLMGLCDAYEAVGENMNEVRRLFKQALQYAKGEQWLLSRDVYYLLNSGRFVELGQRYENMPVQELSRETQEQIKRSREIDTMVSAVFQAQREKRTAEVANLE